MSKKQSTKYHVRKRIFLNRETDMRAFAIGIVEDTREVVSNDENNYSGWIELVLSDCYRHVSFDFNLSSKECRADSLYKIRRIAAIINAVHEAIEIEVKSIAERETAKPKAKAKSATG